MLKELIKKILNFFKISVKNNEKIIIENQNETSYTKKDIMTNYELTFYNKIKELEEDYKIVPQLNLASIVNKKSNYKYQNELYRNIDFAIFSKDYKEILLLIEVNDKTHNSKKRQDRDLKVKKICNDINVKLITFYTYYPNEKSYVINRIKNCIEEQKEKIINRS